MMMMNNVLLLLLFVLFDVAGNAGPRYAILGGSIFFSLLFLSFLCAQDHTYRKQNG